MSVPTFIDIKGDLAQAIRPPAKVESTQDLDQAFTSAAALLNAMRDCYFEGNRPTMIARIQIEKALDAHTKAQSPFAENLRDVCEQVKNPENIEHVGLIWNYALTRMSGDFSQRKEASAALQLEM
jgi:hypothetical protein